MKKASPDLESRVREYEERLFLKRCRIAVIVGIIIAVIISIISDLYASEKAGGSPSAVSDLEMTFIGLNNLPAGDDISAVIKWSKEREAKAEKIYQDRLEQYNGRKSQVTVAMRGWVIAFHCLNLLGFGTYVYISYKRKSGRSNEELYYVSGRCVERDVYSSDSYQRSTYVLDVEGYGCVTINNPFFFCCRRGDIVLITTSDDRAVKELFGENMDTSRWYVNI